MKFISDPHNITPEFLPCMSVNELSGETRPTNTIKKVQGKPTIPGLYYFRDKTSEPGRYYLCGINRVQDEKLGLYAEPVSAPYVESRKWSKIFPEEGMTQLVLSPYPRYRYDPLSEFEGEWWGPIPGPEGIEDVS